MLLTRAPSGEGKEQSRQQVRSGEETSSKTFSATYSPYDVHLIPQGKHRKRRFPGLLLHTEGRLGTSVAPNNCDQKHRTTVELEERKDRRRDISPIASLHRRIKGHD